MRTVIVRKIKIKHQWVQIEGKEVLLPIKTYEDSVKNIGIQLEVKYQHNKIIIKPIESIYTEQSLEDCIKYELKKCDDWEKNILKNIEVFKLKLKDLNKQIQENTKHISMLQNKQYTLEQLKELPPIIEQQDYSY